MYIFINHPLDSRSIARHMGRSCRSAFSNILPLIERDTRQRTMASRFI